MEDSLVGYRIVPIDESEKVGTVSKCTMRPLTEDEIDELANAATPARVSNENWLLKMAEMYHADDNCVVMKTLLQNINLELDIRNRIVTKKFLFDNLDIFAAHKFDVKKVPHDKLNVVIEMSRPVLCEKPYRFSEVKRNIMNNIISEMIKYNICETSGKIFLKGF